MVEDEAAADGLGGPQGPAVSPPDPAFSHTHRLWRWVAFDPPLRNPHFRGCCARTVSCRACGEVIGTTDDPLDALLIAWRHGRAQRVRPRASTAKI
ncbi:MAG TPA: hypothetical protein VMF60_06695 [Acidimicrobiales bacterium]|nr:hypothetical protein [Acidimicrobiales bacterium]